MKSTALLLWYDKNSRALPWRSEKPDPYRVWLSEIMLQQTQVKTMLPFYDRFLKNFPTVFGLARAPVDAVLKFWSGLGYYSRARNLHKAAGLIVKERNGNFPETKEEWLKLPGIGEYTAGAIASIAFGERVPVVDGNVIRVLTRVFALRGDPKKKPLKEKLWKLAEGVVPSTRPGDFNQALMELGALVCLPENPKCPLCPLRRDCKAHRLKKTESFPTPQNRPPVRKVSMQASLIEKGGMFLLARRNGKKHFQSMWEFPQIEPEAIFLKAKFLKELPVVRHAIMNQSIRLTPRLWQFAGGRPRAKGRYVAYRWIRPEELKNFPASSLNRKILKIFDREKA